MTNTITKITNETTLLEIFRETDDCGKDFIVKSLMCVVKFGDKFLDDIQEYVDRKDRNAIRSIVEIYTSRLKEV